VLFAEIDELLGAASGAFGSFGLLKKENRLGCPFLTSTFGFGGMLTV
jgi:hypothetical protein